MKIETMVVEDIEKVFCDFWSECDLWFHVSDFKEAHWVPAS